MRGKYIGRDGSMGFRTGQTYEISTELTKIYRDKKKVDVIMLRSGKLFCPYDSVESILENWEIGETMMENFMNEPVEQNWTENDIIEEYEKYKDKKKVAKVYGVTTQQVTEILKRNV
ncbi:hypothetical protein DWZ70_03045 [Mediterraneibacter gnavus]|uniref:hypothetical protein n=1 Tax=Mediterraneibacter gnavus TaxID=33038 RepID=UPI000E4E7093|nr:hypothetical protein [Mediterraneibacter gnavus]RHM40465.1 hypothetical protein DWZ70_03045 [Mediterraneibacter gnavus]